MIKSVSGDNSISAAPAPDGPPAPGYPAEPPQPYSYQYGVQDEYSGTNFAANENSDTKVSYKLHGVIELFREYHLQVVSGSYTVQLPDGRVQTVTYTADDYTGYVADVKYEGQAVFPEVKPYKPPAAPKYPA